MVDKQNTANGLDEDLGPIENVVSHHLAINPFFLSLSPSLYLYLSIYLSVYVCVLILFPRKHEDKSLQQQLTIPKNVIT